MLSIVTVQSGHWIDYLNHSLLCGPGGASYYNPQVSVTNMDGCKNLCFAVADCVGIDFHYDVDPLNRASCIFWNAESCNPSPHTSVHSSKLIRTTTTAPTTPTTPTVSTAPTAPAVPSTAVNCPGIICGSNGVCAKRFLGTRTYYDRFAYFPPGPEKFKISLTQTTGVTNSEEWTADLHLSTSFDTRFFGNVEVAADMGYSRDVSFSDEKTTVTEIEVGDTDYAVAFWQLVIKSDFELLETSTDKYIKKTAYNRMLGFKKTTGDKAELKPHVDIIQKCNTCLGGYCNNSVSIFDDGLLPIFKKPGKYVEIILIVVGVIVVCVICCCVLMFCGGG